MEQNTIEEIGGMKVFSNPEDLAASMSSTPEQPQAEQVTTEQPTVEETPMQESPAQGVQTEQLTQGNEVHQEAVEPTSDTEYSEGELEGAVMEFLSNRLGRDINSFDEFENTQQAEANAIDERVEAIARFVEETGRAPEDWFRYQSLNPEGMDDMTAIRIQMANQYPNLSYDELDLLVNSKYKVDPDLNTEGEVQLAQLQLKMDGDKARQDIEGIRGKYSTPDYESNAPESVIDDAWVSEMSQEVNDLRGLEFDLGNERTFEFGLDDNYKSELINKNARLDEYFDDYVREDGSWDYDLLSSHRALIDNIDKIVKSVYTQGLGDGQKTIVNTAANVSTQTAPTTNQNQQSDPLAAQLKNIMSGTSGKMTFNI
jgi:hypothetical protein